MSSLAERLIRWQRRHGRHDLPWQRSRDPYRVWLSEIMLQQTQVATVIPYYERFLRRFPDLASLAAAPAEDVMALWSGLGYYARARNLHACAKAVVAEHGARFPDDATVIAALPGIGRSTANAIAAFCFDRRVPILDGNVKRVLCRHFGVEGVPGTPAVEKDLWRLAESLLPAAEVGTYLQAQMDLGATVCTRSRPRCGACPLAETCVAAREGRVAELPAARPRRALAERRVTALVFRDGDRVLLESRPATGVWGGLLSLPELPGGMAPEAFAAQLGLACRSVEPLPSLRHAFTHFRLELAPLLCELSAPPGAAEPGRQWLSLLDVDAAPLPTPIRKVLAILLDQPVVRRLDGAGVVAVEPGEDADLVA